MGFSHPVRFPEDMPHPLVCKNAQTTPRTDIWWGREAPLNPANETEERKMRKMLVLRDRLLAFGGCQACLPLIEEDYDAIMTRGELFYGTGVRMRKGQPSQCHLNSALLWDANRGACQIATGYALSDDGYWRQHSWVVQPLQTKYRVWETTVKRVAYFGFVLSDEECQEFLYNNT